ncbi:hypothetical protein CY34DRAFT_382724 [Suillus luteus UH-Slu-Lm8-n1]|uniref:Unplaced genomic scaffold CY34scaffold_251, whole genome shotgun sequence n=1 Tax=Suillus luteus UH-Slu-Lm8-n1 TaxID=930992 RepID=A0A0D0AW77_9AGAM|nr:hypothetical protein CY34DRAFT_382724 [Suillus luteus UH-Slu-Lm8-n1]
MNWPARTLKIARPISMHLLIAVERPPKRPSTSMEPRSTALAHLNYSVTYQGIERSGGRPEGQRPPRHCRTSMSRNQFDILSLDVSLYSILYIGTYVSLANIDVDVHSML